MSAPVIVTGATGAMGSAAVRKLTGEGVPVIMACRNLQKGGVLFRDILGKNPDARLELLKLDLDSVRGVRDFVSALGDRKIGGIFNNAGVISRGWSLTEDGIEHTMAVNFVNPALLVLLLLPNFAEGARVVNMVSLTTKMTDIGADWKDSPEKDFARLRVYAKSKLAFLLFSIALAEKHPQLRVNVADPGVVNSDMITMHAWYDAVADVVFRPFISSPEKGVAPALRALKAQTSLGYYVGRGVKAIPGKFLSHPMSGELYSCIENLRSGL